jgi:hypothetical protein
MAAAVAGRASNLALDGNRDAGSAHRVVEGNFNLDLLVDAPLGARPSLRTSLTPEELAEDISEILKPPGRSIEVTDVDSKPAGVTPRRAGLSEAAESHIGGAIHPPKGIVLVPFFIVGEYGVRFLDLFELLLGVGFVRIYVGVVPPSQLAIGLLDLGRICGPADPENLIIVF